MLAVTTKAVKVIFTGVCLLAFGATASAQSSTSPKPTIFTTVAKPVTGNLHGASGVQGQLTYTVTAANADNTLSGRVNFTLSNEARQEMARLSRAPLAQVPSSIAKQNVIAKFQPGTEPPVIHLEIHDEELEVVGLKIRVPLIVLDIKARPSEHTRYTVEEMEALFTHMASQINSGRPTRGLIARLNRVIKGE